ncbi:efflux RND transporter periplasmic adaptor subunit [bacterium]|nr:efflux RND transporter periplasmic adaptor subunit [bacterium]
MSNHRNIKSGVALLALSALLLAAAGCGGKAEVAAAAAKDVRATVGQARLAAVPDVVTATGALEAGTTVMVSTRMMGWVREVHVREGQAVAKGDLLISIDDTDLKAKKAQAEAGIAEAKAVLANAEQMAKRFEALYADKSVSKQQLDDVLTGRDRARAGVRMAEAGLKELQVHLSYLEIRSPVDGKVTRKSIEAGNMANPGMPLLWVETEGDMKVVAHLGEKDIAAVAVGTLVDVKVTSLAGAEYSVPLTEIVQTANPGSRTYDIEAALLTQDPRLKSGMFARVTVPVGTRDAVLVPAAAIHRRGQLTGAWVVAADGTAHLRWIRLGRPQGEDFEVLAGLDGTESVVLASEQPLAEGDRVVN